MAGSIMRLLAVLSLPGLPGKEQQQQKQTLSCKPLPQQSVRCLSGDWVPACFRKAGDSLKGEHNSGDKSKSHWTWTP